MAYPHEPKGGNSKRGSKAKKKNSLAFDDYEFLRIELTSKERADFDESESAQLSPFAALADMSIVGYKNSQTWSADGKTCTASLSCTDPEDPNAGGVISGKAGSLEWAIKRLHYKLTVIIGDRLWREAENDRGGSYVEPF